MAERRVVAIDPRSLPPHRGTNYPSPFAERVAGREKRKVGEAFGLTNFGVNLTTLPPGCVSALRHHHATQDELVYVLEGELTLVTDEGETLLTPGMAAGFPKGVPNGHQLVNRSASPATYLEIGDRSPGDRGTYPDDDLVAELSGGRWVFRHKDGTPY